MRDTLVAASTVSALLLSLAILSAGNGLQGTMLGVRAGLEGFNNVWIGVLMSGYYMGFVVGSFVCQRLVLRVGQIRTFAVLASLASAAALLHLVSVNDVVWTVIRFTSGVCYAGLLMVAESWLNQLATPRTRAGLLSVYVMVMMGSWSIGQLFLYTADPSGFILFCVVSIFFSLALVPVGLTRTVAPPLPITSELHLWQLYRATPVGVLGCLMAGLTMGVLWGLGPSYAKGVGLDESQVVFFMFLAMLGGLVMQGPIGWLSDRFDRRRVILAVCLFGALASGGLLWKEAPPELLLLFCFLYGGLTMPVYPLAVAHIGDNTPDAEMISAASGALLFYGIGAMAGPILAGLAMGYLGPTGPFMITTGALLTFYVYARYRISHFATVVPEAQGDYVPLQGQATVVALQLDPRTDTDPEALSTAEMETAPAGTAV